MMAKIWKDWQDIVYLLGLFGKTLGAAKRSYSAFLANGVAHGRHPDMVGGGLILPVGGWPALKGCQQS